MAPVGLEQHAEAPGIPCVSTISESCQHWRSLPASFPGAGEVSSEDVSLHAPQCVLGYVRVQPFTVRQLLQVMQEVLSKHSHQKRIPQEAFL